LMLDHLGLAAQADRLLRAVAAATAAGQVTPDLGGRLTTREAADAIMARLPNAAVPSGADLAPP